MYLNDEIFLEYEEVLKSKYSQMVAANFLSALKELPNVNYTSVYFRWNLISDPDDNKFVDCYIASGATFLVTHDAHFSILKTVPFPKVNVIKIDEFQGIIKQL